MYPILYRLVDQHFVSFREIKVGKRQSRIYYHLEEDGKAYYNLLLSSYKSFISIIDFLLTSSEGDEYSESINGKGN